MFIVDTRTCTFEVTEDQILVCTSKPRSPEGLEEARENVAAIDGLCSEFHLPMLADMTHSTSQSREARAHYAANPIATAVALVVTNPVSRVLGNFYLGLNKPAVPTRLFSDTADAREWLRAYPPSRRQR